MTALKAPCEHGRYEAHPLPEATATMILGSAGLVFAEEDLCSGGTLLPPDTLVIVKEDATIELMAEAMGRNQFGEIAVPNSDMKAFRSDAIAILDALAAGPGRE